MTSGTRSREIRAAVGQHPMHLIERVRPHDVHEFFVDCAHGTTSLDVLDYPRVDRARGSGIFGQLIKKHRRAMDKAYAEGAIDERCACQAQQPAP